MNLFKSKNTFYEKDGYMVGVTQSGIEFLFDKEDFDVVQWFTWGLNGNGYVQCHDRTYGSRMIQLHRMTLHLEDPKVQVDHINHNKLDNRKSNLRECTLQENCGNRTDHLKNTSGYKGVTWHKGCNKWEAQIGVKNKRIHLGTYVSKEEAAKAYNIAASFYFGEFAKLNNIKEVS